MLIVINGERGSGFSVQSASLDLLRELPELLESMAAEIRSDMRAAEARQQQGDTGES